jgi:hypothetical protein
MRERALDLGARLREQFKLPRHLEQFELPIRIDIIE